MPSREATPVMSLPSAPTHKPIYSMPAVNISASTFKPASLVTQTIFEHLFAQVHDTTYALLLQRNVAAPVKPVKEVREPIYKTVTLIKNPATIDKVLG